MKQTNDTLGVLSGLHETHISLNTIEMKMNMNTKT